MTRVREFYPPPHLADVFHRHPCPKCGVSYPCYGPRHEDGAPRLCGSSGCRS